MELPRYFTDIRLVNKLCNKRVRQVRENRRRRFLQALASDQEKSEVRSVDKELNSLLPPRRIWSHFRPRQKERRDVKEDQTRLLAKNMARYVLRELKRSQPRFAWVRRLKEFLNTVRFKALGWKPGHQYKRLRVIAVHKVGNKFRAITLYSLMDSLVVSGFACYLRDAIEPILGDYNFAFRAASGSGDGRVVPTHHKAFDELRKFRLREKGRLWVAECDIKGFFDAVPHQTVYNALNAIRSELNGALDIRFDDFLNSFLTCYNYDDIVSEAKESLSGKIKNPEFPKPSKTTKTSGFANSKIGIPQGSSLSCVLANLVLILPDRAARRSLGPDGLYIRYCDDIIISHREKKNCRDALSSYINALSDAKLPWHPLEEIKSYKGAFRRKYWESKSKATYEWSSEGIPWIGFVGYQARYDGKVRIRHSSIIKERKKQDAVAFEFGRQLLLLERKAKSNGKQVCLRSRFAIRYRVVMHLLSIGVGYPRGRQVKPAQNSISWSNGFEIVKKEPDNDLTSLRILDRGRTNTIRKVDRLLHHAIKRGFLTFPQHNDSNKVHAGGQTKINLTAFVIIFVVIG